MTLEKARYRTRTRLLYSAGLLLVALLAIGQTTSTAQTWEYAYGGDPCEDRGEAIVTASAFGGDTDCDPAAAGFISVGTSESQSDGNCSANTDVYVTRTDANGAIVWSHTYDIGGDDVGMDIKEVSTGGFIVTGNTENIPPTGEMTCFNTTTATHDAFLLRIDECGNVLWINTYGAGATSIETGNEVIEAQTADLMFGSGAAVGDFVVAGSSDGNGNIDGLLFRTDANGTMLWSMTYGTVAGKDVFHGLVESMVGGTGDIVAVGTTYGQQLPPTQDLYIARVNGFTGAVGAAPQGFLAYGGVGREIGTSVDELQIPPNAGTIVITGASTSAPPPPIGYPHWPCAPPGGVWPSDEIMIVATGANPALGPIAEIQYGDQCNGQDFGMGIREIRGITGSQGNIVVTGYTQLYENGATFLMEILPAPMPPFPGVLTLAPGWGQIKVYGGESYGTSVTEVSGAAYTTHGYAVTGAIWNALAIGNTDAIQKQMLRTDNVGVTDCEEGIDMIAMNPLLPSVVGAGVLAPFIVSCDSEAEVDILTYEDEICPLPFLEKGIHNLFDGSSEQNDFSLSSYPNPVRSGETIQLEYESSANDLGTRVSVFDATGVTRYESLETSQDGEGMRHIEIETTGWTSGLYLVSIQRGDKRSISKIIVTEE